jgi:hypothetical protein
MFGRRLGRVCAGRSEEDVSFASNKKGLVGALTASHTIRNGRGIS